MPTWRVTLGMALGTGMVGIALGWAARPADVGWHAAGLTGSVADCAALGPTVATARALLDPSAAGVQEWWLRREHSGALVEVVRSEGGERVRLQHDEATGSWQPVTCAVSRP